MTDGLKDKYRKAIIEILSANERVEKVVLFGSRAMGTFTPTSDVDIALFGDQLTMTDQAKLAEAIDELSIPQRVDILLYKSIKNEKLIEHIKRHGVEWYRRSWAVGSEWTPTTVGSFCPFTYGKGLPTKKRNTNGNIKVYGSNGPVGMHDQPLVNEPGIVIGRKGSVGAVHFASEPFWPIDTTFYVVSEADRDLKYTYYLLKSIGLENMNADSAVPGLNRDAAHARQILVPEYDEQRAIAHILGSLDDKIELNRRMNETLEAMARAIFKSWFVNFDPVRTRMGDPVWSPTKRADLRVCPYMTPEILNLFPDSFQDSDLGEIPKGWKIKTIGEVVEFAYGKALKASNRKPGNVPVFGSNGPVGLHDEALVKGPGIVIGRKGNPGIVTWSSKDFFPIDTTFYVKKTGSITSLNYLFYALKNQYLPSLSADSAVPGLNRNLAYMNNILVPSDKALSAFDKQIRPLFKKIDANDDESVTLAALRDALLPKLISGELRLPAAVLELAVQADVPYAEKFVEPACALHADMEAGA